MRTRALVHVYLPHVSWPTVKTVEDALEHFDYNMKGSSQGDDYPMFLDIELNPVIDNGEYSYEIVE